jgi:phage FluMu protein Com
MTEEIIWSRKPFYHPINCNKCSTIIEFIPPLSIPQQLKVRCYKCQAINTIEKEHILDFGGAKSQFPSTSSTNGTLPWGNINTGTSK